MLQQYQIFFTNFNIIEINYKIKTFKYHKKNFIKKRLELLKNIQKYIYIKIKFIFYLYINKLNNL